ncbi:Non-specific serine/threonine protein kinase [Aphelenchoides besseyi]|nr:Non-specific serine/threonine protein kinase [Aphelenchoides besseyi]
MDKQFVGVSFFLRRACFGRWFYGIGRRSKNKLTSEFVQLVSPMSIGLKIRRAFCFDSRYFGMTALDRLQQLERLYLCGAPYDESFSLETLLDTLICLYDECCNSTLRREKSIAEFVEFAHPIISQVKALRLSRDDFELLKVIGQGSFGEVAVVKMKNTEKVYAMKVLNKWEMIKRAETACFREERDVMVFGDRKWITNLHFAFQDEKNLYLIMDYYVGGDLLTLLSKFEIRLPESLAKFYIAEMILAIDSVHRLGYVHRDVKPDNVLLDITGHIKLGDFGSCLKRLPDGTVRTTTAVGTPDYISPETLRAVESGRESYGAECDWWSLGICLYEMLYGETPFYAESLVETYGKIMSFDEMFEFPEDIETSDEARDLISRLICKREHRLGQNGLEDFRHHPFFEGIDWENIRHSTAPYIPEVSSPTDTSNFDIDNANFTTCNTQPPNVTAAFTGHHLPFIGFTYTHSSPMSDCFNLVDATIDAGDAPIDPSAPNGSTRRDSFVNRLEQEKAELQRQLSEVLPNVGTRNGGEAQELIAQLRDEIQILHRRLEDEVSAGQRPVKEANVEETCKKEVDEHTNRLTLLTAGQSELNANLDTLTQRLEENERELEEQKTRNGRLENELADAMAVARQHQELNEELTASERQFRTAAETATARSDQLEKELENERTALSILRAKLDVQQSEGLSAAAKEGAEVQRLQEELQRMQERHNDTMQQEERRRVAEVEAQKRENENLHERIQKLLADHDAEKLRWNRQHEEHLLSMENLYNKKIKNLITEVGDLKSENEHLKTETTKLENDLFNQQSNSVPQSQVEELLNMLTDEKEARQTLQDLTSRLTNDVEVLKYRHQSANSTPTNGNARATYANTPVTTSVGDNKTWGSRRMTKQAKYGRFEAQQQLDAEIRAKQQVLEELRLTRTRCDETEKQLSEQRQRTKQVERENQELRDRLALEHRNEMTSASGNVFVDHGHHPLASMQRYNPAFLNAIASNSEFGTYGQRSGQHGDMSLSDYESPTTPIRAANIPGYLNQMASSPFPSYENHSRSVSNSIFYGTSTPGSSIRQPTKTPKTIQSLNNALNNSRSHRFTHARLSEPTKCGHCTSILVGLDRQGMICQDCSYPCHVNCVSKVPSDCPVPNDQRRPLGIDPQKGVGTAYEGFVKTPKPTGLKRGWLQTYVVVCDFKLLLYDCQLDKHNKQAIIENSIRQVFDMRDPDFKVGNVTENDAIHASKSELPKIFKVLCSQIQQPAINASSSGNDTIGSQGSNASNHSINEQSALSQYALLMAETPEEAKKWVIALSELKNLVARSRLPNKSAFFVKELCDVSAMPILRTAQCAKIIDRTKFVLGFADHGLMCVELDKELLIPVGGEKENNKRNVEKIEYDEEEQLLIALVGGNTKDRHVRLIPTAALDGRDLKWIKVNETKGCHLMCAGTGPTTRLSRRSEPANGNNVSQPTAINQLPPHYFAVAVQKSVIVFDINRQENRHKKLRDFAMPAMPQTMRIFGGRLYVGYMSSYRVWDLSDGTQTSLVNLEDGSLQFLNQNPYDAKLLIAVNDEENPNEFLLLFHNLGVYVDAYGRRSRAQELMFPCRVTEMAYHRPYLCMYSEHQIDVFHVQTSEWIQTINLKRSKPLSEDALLNVCIVADMPYLVLLSGVTQPISEQLYVPLTPQNAIQGKGVQKRRRKFSVKSSRETASRGDRRSQLPISGPTDFIHVVHMGSSHVADLQSNLMDLRGNTNSTNSSTSSPHTAQSDKLKNILANPVMRSASAASPHSLAGYQQQPGRPLSSHSRASEGSSMSKESRMQSSLSQLNTTSGSMTIADSSESYYLEPTNKQMPSINSQPPFPNTLPPTPNRD